MSFDSTDKLIQIMQTLLSSGRIRCGVRTTPMYIGTLFQLHFSG